MTKEEILKKHLNIMLIEHSNDYNTVEVMSEQPEYKIILEAMEEYALQQVKNSGIIPPVVESEAELPEKLCLANSNFKCNCIDGDYCPNFK